MKYKICNKCKQEKAIVQFSRVTPDTCKLCKLPEEQPFATSGKVTKTQTYKIPRALRKLLPKTDVTERKTTIITPKSKPIIIPTKQKITTGEYGYKVVTKPSNVNGELRGDPSYANMSDDEKRMFLKSQYKARVINESTNKTKRISRIY